MSATAAETGLTETEREGLELVRETRGIHQSEFWKALDISSRKGSRVVDSLVEQDLIQREETVYDGHNTYHLTPMPSDLEFSLLMAGDMLSPFVGDEEVDPQSDAFTQWVMSLAYEE